MELYLSVVIGASLYFLFDFAGKVGGEVFSKKYILTTVVNVFAGIALVWLTQLKEGVMQVAWFDAARLIASAFGIIGQKTFKSLIDVIDKNVKTKIGVNKK